MPGPCALTLHDLTHHVGSSVIRHGKIEEPRQNETVGIAVVVEGRDDDRS